MSICVYFRSITYHVNLRMKRMTHLMKMVMFLSLDKVVSTSLAKKEPSKRKLKLDGLLTTVKLLSLALCVGLKLLKVMLFAMTKENCKCGFTGSLQDDRQNRD